NEVFRRRDLLGDVEIGVLDLDRRADLGSMRLHALDDVLVPFVRGVIDDVADPFRRAGSIGTDSERGECRTGDEQSLYGLHLSLPPNVSHPGTTTPRCCLFVQRRFDAEPDNPSSAAPRPREISSAAACAAIRTVLRSKRAC